MPNEDSPSTAVETLESVKRLNRDLKKASDTLSLGEVRFLVDGYYLIQEYRKASANQFRALEKSKEPNEVLGWFVEQSETLENQIRRVLNSWTGKQKLGQWCKSITGIGPVITAGLMAHIDVKKAPTVGHIWRFAGLDPTVEWLPKTKRPWNAALKTLCWKIGESFVMVSANDSDVYGKVWIERKDLEIQNNDAGKFKEIAAGILAKKNFKKTTEAYKAYITGKLPPAHIHARAKRYAVKMFLAHYHHVAHEIEFNTPPPKPYVIEHLGHVHYMGPPNWPMVEKGK